MKSYRQMNVQNAVCWQILTIFTLLTSTTGRAAEVDVHIISLPQTIRIFNEGETVTPTIYIIGETVPSSQGPRWTSGATLNGVRLSNRMLSQGVLILRPDNTGTFGYRAGFELFPEPIDQWPEHDQFFGKCKYDPVQPAPVVKTVGNFLQVCVNHRPVSTLYELSFDRAIQVKGVTLEARCDQRDSKFKIITRVWADRERTRLLGEAKTASRPNSSRFLQTITGLDASSVFVELTSNGQANWAGLYAVTLSAQLDTANLKLPSLIAGENLLEYMDDENSSHRGRVVLRWGDDKPKVVPPAFPEWLSAYSSPARELAPASQSVAKLNKFFPLGMYGGIYDYPASVVSWMLGDMASHHCNAWHVNNLDVKRLPELLSLAEQRNVRVLAQGGGWESLYYSARGSVEEQKKRYEELLAPTARKIIPQFSNRWGMLGWSLTEEITPPSVRELSPYYDLMRRLDTTHEPLILHNRPDACKEDVVINHAPVVYFDIYPFFIDGRSGPCTAKSSLKYYHARLEAYAKIAQDGRVPMWVMMQAFGEPPQFNPDPPFFGYHGGRPVPTAPELSVQVWLALAYGAKGLWFYPYRDRRADATGPLRSDWKSTDIWNQIESLYRNVSQISGVLLSLEPDPNPPKATIDGQNIFAAWHRVKGSDSPDRYLVIANENLEGPERVRITPLGSNERVLDWTNGKPIESNSKTMKPGEGALFLLRRH